MSDSFGLASTQRPVSATTANTGWPAAATRPSSICGTCVATPSIGASTLVLRRLRSASSSAGLGLHVVGELVDRRVGAAAELHRDRRLLLAHEFKDLLGLNEVGHRGVAIGGGSRAAGREVVLAIEVGLADATASSPILIWSVLLT